MKILSIITAGALALALATAGSSTTGVAGHVYDFHYENILGTSLDLKVNAVSPVKARLAEAAVLREIAQESKILSSWDPDSEVSLWARARSGYSGFSRTISGSRLIRCMASAHKRRAQRFGRDGDPRLEECGYVPSPSSPPDLRRQNELNSY